MVISEKIVVPMLRFMEIRKKSVCMALSSRSNGSVNIVLGKIFNWCLRDTSHRAWKWLLHCKWKSFHSVCFFYPVAFNVWSETELFSFRLVLFYFGFDVLPLVICRCNGANKFDGSRSQQCLYTNQSINLNKFFEDRSHS